MSLVHSENEEDSILVIVDHFYKMVHFVSCKHMAKCCHCGTTILSQGVFAWSSNFDFLQNGTQFLVIFGVILGSLSMVLLISVMISPSNWRTNTNDNSFRVLLWIISFLRSTLSWVKFSNNHVVNCATRLSPFYIIYSLIPRCLVDLLMLLCCIQLYNQTSNFVNIFAVVSPDHLLSFAQV